jgi:hypothetical protein
MRMAAKLSCHPDLEWILLQIETFKDGITLESATKQLEGLASSAEDRNKKDVHHGLLDSIAKARANFIKVQGQWGSYLSEKCPTQPLDALAVTDADGQPEECISLYNFITIFEDYMDSDTFTDCVNVWCVAMTKGLEQAVTDCKQVTNNLHEASTSWTLDLSDPDDLDVVKERATATLGVLPGSKVISAKDAFAKAWWDRG